MILTNTQNPCPRATLLPVSDQWERQPSARQVESAEKDPTNADTSNDAENNNCHFKKYQIYHSNVMLQHKKKT